MRDLSWDLAYIRDHRFCVADFSAFLFFVVNGFIRKYSEASTTNFLITEMSSYQPSSHCFYEKNKKKYGVFSVRDTNYQR